MNPLPQNFVPLSQSRTHKLNHPKNYSEAMTKHSRFQANSSKRETRSCSSRRLPTVPELLERTVAAARLLSIERGCFDSRDRSPVTEANEGERAPISGPQLSGHLYPATRAACDRAESREIERRRNAEDVARFRNSGPLNVRRNCPATSASFAIREFSD